MYFKWMKIIEKHDNTFKNQFQQEKRKMRVSWKVCFNILLKKTFNNRCMTVLIRTMNSEAAVDHHVCNNIGYKSLNFP